MKKISEIKINSEHNNEINYYLNQPLTLDEEIQSHIDEKTLQELIKEAEDEK